MRILLVEDEADTRYAMQLALNMAGHDVRVAEDGQVALQTLMHPNADFDLMIMDLAMPGLTGEQLVGELETRNMPMPFVTITGNASLESVKNMMDKGCKGFLLKPVEAGSLLELLGHISADNVKSVVRHRPPAHFFKADLLAHSQIHTEIMNKRGEVLLHTLPEHWQQNDVMRYRQSNEGVSLLLASMEGQSQQHALLRDTVEAFCEQCNPSLDCREVILALNAKILALGLGVPVKALCVRLNPHTRQGEVIACGQPPLILQPADGHSPRHIMSNGDLLGMKANIQLFSKRFMLGTGDRLFIHSESVEKVYRLDAGTGIKHFLTSIGLKRMLAKYSQVPLATAVNGAIADVLHFGRGADTTRVGLLGMEMK